MLSNKALSASKTGGALPTEIEYVGGYTTTVAGGTSNVTVSLTSLSGGLASSPSIGDVVIVYFAISGASTSETLVINGYTELAQVTVADTYDSRLLVAFKVLTAADTSFVINGGTKDASDSGAVAVQVFRGAKYPVTVATSTTADTALPNPPSVTPTETGAWVIAGGGAAHARGAQTFTSSDLTNFITVGSNETYDATVGMGYKVWTSGAFDPAQFGFTGSDSNQYSSTAATIVLNLNNGASQQEFTTTGDTSWTVPVGVNSVSVVCIGGGEGGGPRYGGDGGNLRYENNIAVTPGETLTVTVGAGGSGVFTPVSGTGPGGDSSLKRSSTVLCLARGGGSTTTEVGTGYTGGNGGYGYIRSSTLGSVYNGGGGGGAAGYSGNGGNGGTGNPSLTSPTAGSGGGGGGGGLSTADAKTDGSIYFGTGGSTGGGTGISAGQGSNGSAGSNSSSPTSGGGGSGGTSGGLYGGGGSGGYTNSDNGPQQSGQKGGQGAVRIIWPGDSRSYPSTRTANE